MAEDLDVLLMAGAVCSVVRAVLISAVQSAGEGEDGLRGEDCLPRRREEFRAR